MKFEIAYIQDGELVRGGIAASLRTVGRWIEQAITDDPDTTYLAVPASSDALSIEQAKAETI